MPPEDIFFLFYTSAVCFFIHSFVQTFLAAPFPVTQPSFFFTENQQCWRLRLKAPSNISEQVITTGQKYPLFSGKKKKFFLYTYNATLFQKKVLKLNFYLGSTQIKMSHLNSITKCEKQTESTISPHLLLPLCNFNGFYLWHQIQNMQCNDFFFSNHLMLYQQVIMICMVFGFYMTVTDDPDSDFPSSVSYYVTWFQPQVWCSDRPCQW